MTVSREEFEAVAKRYCPDPIIHRERFEFQDATPGFWGEYLGGVWTLGFNGAKGTGATPEEAEENLGKDEAERRRYYEMNCCQ